MSYGRTFHVFVPDCLPATLIIIPYRPAIVNHKFAFSAKKLETRLSVFKKLHFCGLYLCHHSSLSRHTRRKLICFPFCKPL